MQQHHGSKLFTGRGIAQKYYIKYESGWAYVLLDQSGPLVSVVSDWGSWNHRLDSIGDRTILDFVVSTSPSYFRDKFQAQTGGYGSILKQH